MRPRGTRTPSSPSGQRPTSGKAREAGFAIRPRRLRRHRHRRLVVGSGERRRGIGHALAERCAELARTEGWPAIALWSRAYQTAGHHLYESLGYERLPERDSVDETGFDRLVFRLPILR